MKKIVLTAVAITFAFVSFVQAEDLKSTNVVEKNAGEPANPTDLSKTINNYNTISEQIFIEKGLRRRDYSVGCGSKRINGSEVGCWTERAFFKEQALLNATGKCLRETGNPSSRGC